MKSILFFVFAGALWAQSAPQPLPPAAPLPDVPPDTVVATFGEGQKLTAGELKSFLAVMPPNMQQSALHDRKQFVQQFALMHALAAMAEQAKLDQQSPTRESLAFNRMYLLMNAQLHEVLSGMHITPADAEAFYNQAKNRYTQVKVKAIYIAFSGEPKHLSEAEAMAKISKIRADILAGAEFVKMVKENSQDQVSVAKDGDFGTIRRSDNLPDAIRSAIFSLKAGEVSEPVRQPNGFYLFRAEEISAQPYAEVQDEILKDLQQARFHQWMEETIQNLHFKIQDEGYFAQGGAANGR
ncbi:MAG TPA: peptidylprolyl isomerase [Bryobacteraceae bacterium]|nr:peptidylprolyl isomerase [Bryobacteraceae bacterium]